MDYIIVKAQPSDNLPYHLLLLADENPQLIEVYLPYSLPYIVKVDGQAQGICLLRPLGETGEIVNIAVAPSFQSQGIGRALLRYALVQAKLLGIKRLVIKTGNSSLKQLALYQQVGFDLIKLNHNYFLQAYSHPIWENNIQCKHQLVFEYHF